MPDALLDRFAGLDARPVGVGHSGAAVHHLTAPSGTEAYYLKSVRSTDDAAVAELAGEAQRTAWLHGQGGPAAQVLEHDEHDGVAWLLTRALPGRSLAEAWPAGAAAACARSLAAALRDLHALTACPFRRDLAVTVPAARAAVDAGTVDLDDLDAERAGRTGHDLLDELERTLPAGEDLVVCHGDLCAPNALFDPGTYAFTGFCDLGRLGVADRHADLALFTRSADDPDLNPHLGGGTAVAFLRAYGGAVDDRRLRFYRLLDEFF